ncbi:MAG: hypothetical protein ABL903_03995 [Methylococcales bacterium]
MTKREIQKALENTLLNNEKMAAQLYEYELEAMLDELKAMMLEDGDDSIFAITVHKNDLTLKQDTAMVLIEKSGEVHVNEAAKAKLKEIWIGSYAVNMRKLLPEFAEQLRDGEIPINGIKTILVD